MAFAADQATCRSCNELYPSSDLDRYLWCPRCRGAVQRRSSLWSRASGIVASLGVGLYVALAVRPQRFLILYVPILILTYFLIARIAQEVVRGYYRARGGAGESTASPDGD